MLEQMSEWRLGGILMFILLNMKWILNLVKWKWILVVIFFRCLDSSVYTCTTACIWTVLTEIWWIKTTYFFSFPCPNIHMQPYEIQPRIYRGFTHVSDFKDWAALGKFSFSSTPCWTPHIERRNKRYHFETHDTHPFHPPGYYLDGKLIR